MILKNIFNKDFSNPSEHHPFKIIHLLEGEGSDKEYCIAVDKIVSIEREHNQVTFHFTYGKPFFFSCKTREIARWNWSRILKFLGDSDRKCLVLG